MCDGTISGESLWVTVTPSPVTLALPFYVIEAGHFICSDSYLVARDKPDELMDNYLFLYTVKGEGYIQTENTSFLLPSGCAAVIDCSRQHKYHSNYAEWEMFWFHFNGTAAELFFHLLYFQSVCALPVAQNVYFEEALSRLISLSGEDALSAAVENSSVIHSMLSSLVTRTFDIGNENKIKAHSDDIDHVLEFIKNNYDKSITVNDMTDQIHVSKYHFIRIFRRVTGMTPYRYLMNYRINTAKTLLRSTSKNITEIAAECGFSDTSNFVTQFKKITGYKPTDYRKYFDQNSL